MAQLIVRNFDDDLKLKLQIQAKSKGLSMEEEVRRILSKSLDKSESNTGTLIASHFKDLDFNFEPPKMKGQGMRYPDFQE